MTRRSLCLSLLEDAGPQGVTTGEFLQAGVGSRYGARLLELRKQGYVITSERIRDGSWRYVLVSDASDVGLGVDAGDNGVSLQPDAATTASVGRPGGVESDGASGHLFSLPDAYEELRRKDVLK